MDNENIEHTKVKAKPPRTNGVCERFNKTCKDKFYSIAFMKKIYRGIDEIQHGLYEWIKRYSHERTQSGKYCYGKNRY
ncbi:MAG: integrase core domain-containing protein [Treponema sp.]|nr:integrase core domain-containing protein [Treponema sp.]